MPNGFWYASGPLLQDAIIAGSAFSKGDVLALDSNSSLSRLNPYAATTSSIFAIANSDSTNSVNNLCTVTVVEPTTCFWGRVTAGGAYTTGDESGVSFATALSGRYEADASSTTNVVVVVKGTDRVDQSVESKALFRFKYADSELDLA